MSKSSSDQPKVLIAGAGIGGLTLALALHRVGIASEVFEAAREIRPLGVGINVPPHASAVLRDLGVEKAISEVALETAEAVYFNRFGQRIWGEPRGRDAGYPVPQYSIHRGELQMILHRAVAAALGPRSVHAGQRLIGFAQDADGVTAEFTRRDGNETSSVRGSVLVGADGIHSEVRRTLYPDEGEPVFAGRMMWRGTTEWSPFLTGRSMIWFGTAEQKFMCYPISAPAARRGRSLINWVATRRVDLDHVPRSDWNARVPNETAHTPYADWHFDLLDVAEVIRHADAIYEFPMVDRDPLPAWTHGRVTLLGDAAHPMYPAGSNGAAQAILDAHDLAGRFAAGLSPEAALAAYDAERRPATARIIEANRRDGPDQVLQLAHERAPQGFSDIEDVIPHAELEAIASGYKQTAGFDRDNVRRLAGGRR